MQGDIFSVITRQLNEDESGVDPYSSNSQKFEDVLERLHARIDEEAHRIYLALTGFALNDSIVVARANDGEKTMTKLELFALLTELPGKLEQLAFDALTKIEAAGSEKEVESSLASFQKDGLALIDEIGQISRIKEHAEEPA